MHTFTGLENRSMNHIKIDESKERVNLTDNLDSLIKLQVQTAWAIERTKNGLDMLNDNPDDYFGIKNTSHFVKHLLPVKYVPTANQI